MNKKYLQAYYLAENYLHKNYEFCLDDFSVKFWETFDEYNYIDKLYVYLRGDKIEDIILPEIMCNLYFKKIGVFIYQGMFFSLLLFVLYITVIASVIRYVRYVYFMLKLRNEINNNLSNYCDINRLVILFLFFFNFSLSLYTAKHFLYNNFNFFSMFLALNIVEIISYLYLFNVNIFVFIKGTLDEINLFFVELFDSISLVTFIARLLLQFLRLIICIVVFFNMHMLGNELLDVLNNYYIGDNNIEPQDYLSFFLKTIIEYLDMLINFCTQYSLYIIVVMWLLPFLFSFVKKFLKIKNV